MLSIQNAHEQHVPKMKLVHPKVLKVLHYLNVPSPIRIVRDEFQPISGNLTDKPKLIPREIQPIKTKVPEKEQISLNLSMNRIRERRTSLSNPKLN